MAIIDLTNVKQLKAASSEQDANKLIKEGWILIDSASGQDDSNYPIIRYSLAWTKDTPPPAPEY